tara:strand:- start:1134 stop:1364 length:231 start_codon:yes stop_codon:yes gene_type:complete
MSKDYVWNNEKLADILMTLAAIPNVDELQDEILKGFADELRKYDSLVTDLANELEKALNENEMLKGRILDLAGRIK